MNAISVDPSHVLSHTSPSPSLDTFLLQGLTSSGSSQTFSYSGSSTISDVVLRFIGLYGVNFFSVHMKKGEGASALLAAIVEGRDKTEVTLGLPLGPPDSSLVLFQAPYDDLPDFESQGYKGHVAYSDGLVRGLYTENIGIVTILSQKQGTSPISHFAIRAKRQEAGKTNIADSIPYSTIPAAAESLRCYLTQHFAQHIDRDVEKYEKGNPIHVTMHFVGCRAGSSRHYPDYVIPEEIKEAYMDGVAYGILGLIERVQQVYGQGKPFARAVA